MTHYAEQRLVMLLQKQEECVQAMARMSKELADIQVQIRALVAPCDAEGEKQTWQEFLRDYAVADTHCAQGYGCNVYIAMYVAAAEETGMLKRTERLGDNTENFYRELSEIMGFVVNRKSVEWQINHFWENAERKQYYRYEILPLTR